MSSRHDNVATAEVLLRLGDDRLILGHRLSEWCGHAPILEEDIALTNIALDCLGHATLFLDEAGRAEGKGRDADALAFGREGPEFRNCLLVEQPNGDFAFTIVRQVLMDTYSDLLYGRLEHSTSPALAAVAGKAHKEIQYHRRHSGEWLLRLGDGTDESHTRAQDALDELWKYTGELFCDDEVSRTASANGLAPNPAELRNEWHDAIRSLLLQATLRMPGDRPHILMNGRAGRHTESLGHLLSVMQSVPRAHPGASW